MDMLQNTSGKANIGVSVKYIEQQMRKIKRQLTLERYQQKMQRIKDSKKQGKRLNGIARNEHFLGDGMILKSIMNTPNCDKYNISNKGKIHHVPKVSMRTV